MKTQNYSNHIRYYNWHHFVFYPLMAILFFLSLWFSYSEPQHLLWFFLAIIAMAIILLSFMLRQHYALILQDRIVKLELRYRFFVQTGQKFETLESQLTDNQIYALRFAQDLDLPGLVEKTIEKNLNPEQIKKAIKNWKPDLARV